MKILIFYSCVFIILNAQSSTAFGQNSVSVDGISFAKEMIGKHLSSIKDSLRCVDMDCDTIVMKNKPPIRSFAYIKPGRNIRTIGQVTFSMAFVFTDSVRIVDNVQLMTLYNKTETLAYREQFEKDFEELLNYLRSVFKSRGKKGLYYKNQDNKQSNIQWKIDGFFFTLTKDEFRKTDKLSDFYIITFTVFKDIKLTN